MAYGYEGSKVRLVPLDKERHMLNCQRWLNDIEITENLLVGGMPLSLATEEKFFDEILARTDEAAFAIETLEGQHIGMSGVHQINHLHGHCTTGSFIGEKSLWGQGYGSDNVRVRLKFVFEQLNMRIVTTSALEGNERSIRMSKGAGFVEYGFIPDRYWKNGRYRGEHRMMITRDQWLARQS